MVALILERVGRQFRLWDEDEGKLLLGYARSRLYRAAGGLYPGDRVDVERIGQHDAVIVGYHSRKNLVDPPGVANVDRVLIVMSWRLPDFDEVHLHRVRVRALAQGIESVAVINKVDLVTVSERAELEQLLEAYRAAAIPLYPISALRGEGLEALWGVLPGGVLTLAGPSGVGKSSLLNRLIPGVNRPTREVQIRSGRGRHTTTSTCLIAAGPTTWIADTPGFQRVILDASIDPKVVERVFPLLHRLAVACRFDDCRHIREPGCAVHEAVEAGDLPSRWYRLYRVLLHEIETGPVV